MVDSEVVDMAANMMRQVGIFLDPTLGDPVQPKVLGGCNDGRAVRQKAKARGAVRNIGDLLAFAVQAKAIDLVVKDI